MRPLPPLTVEPSRSTAKCSACNDTGWKPSGTGRNAPVVRCQCWLDDTAQWLLQHAGIPPKHAKAGFDNFLVDPDNERMVRAKHAAQRFADRWPLPIQDDGKHSLCFIGNYGIGKTHLAIAALRAVILHKGARGLFLKQTELLSLIRQTYAPDAEVSERDVLRPAKMADVLVLDDVGIDNPTEFVTLKLFELFDERINHRRATILTTNFENSDDPGDMRSLQMRVAGIVHSRLTEVCEYVEFKAGDYRHMPRNGGTVADLKALFHQFKQRAATMMRGGPAAKPSPRSNPDQPKMPEYWGPRITNDPTRRDK